MHHQVNGLFLERRTGERTYRNGLIEVSRSRNTIRIEELGWGAQRAEAGFLRSAGREGWSVRVHTARQHYPLSSSSDRMHLLGTI